jgi:hypothetical protein
MSNLTKTWALNQTAVDTISVATGVLAAATSDNVQALAILACEGLGATLPMTAETCSKVNKLCTRDHQGAVLSFLKATIGYKRGDCAWQLAQSDAGVRFLGLASALLTLDSWAAAQTINTLIRNTAEDKKMVPTTLQLKQLIEALNYKHSLASFAEAIVGWSILVSRGQGTRRCGTDAPSQKLIVNLVQALSAVSRIGDSDSQKVEITVLPAEFAWIIAFIKWAVGTPTVVTGNEEVIKGEDEAVVTVRILTTDALTSRPQITTLNELGEIKDLVKDLPRGLGTFSGMISLKRFSSPESLAFRACVEALPLTCLRALKYIRLQHLRDEGKASTNSMFQTFPRNSELCLEACQATWTSIFPSKSKILAALASFLGVDNVPEPDLDTADVLLVHDLPLVNASRKVLENRCSCPKYQHKRSQKCSFDKFCRDLSVCASVVLRYSLIESTDPDGTRLYYGSDLGCDQLSLAAAVKTLAFGAISTAECNISLAQLIYDTLQLVGHDVNQPKGESLEWIMSSYKGQTLFSKLFGTRCLEVEGVVSIMCVSGAIWWSDERYEFVQSSALMKASVPFHPESLDFLDNLHLEDDELPEEQINLAWKEADVPSNAFPDFRLLWQVGARERKLHVNLVCLDLPTMPQRPPTMALYAATESLVVNCEHGKNSALNGSPRGLQITTPARPVPFAKSPPGTVGIVQSDGNEAMRFFSLAAGQRGVISGDACLECCVLCSRITGIEFIIC